MVNFLKRLFQAKRAELPSPPSAYKEELPEIGSSEILQEMPRSPNSFEPSRVSYVDLPPYEPTFDLRDYHYPTLELFKSELRRCIIDLGENQNNFSLPIIWSIEGTSTILKDLAEIPSIFICGNQETGKTAFVNQLIISLLITRHPSQLKFVIAGIQPIELNTYNLIEKHFLGKLPGEDAIIKDTFRLVKSLNALCIEMDNRFGLLKAAGARNIFEYNEQFKARKLNPRQGHKFLPFIVLIIDDLTGFALNGKELLQAPLERLITSGYKVGILAVITSNPFSGHSIIHPILKLIVQRVVFNLYNKDDYKKFFDTSRVARFLNQGEFLYNEGPIVHTGSDILFTIEEIEKVTSHIGAQKGYPQAYLLPEHFGEEELNFDLNDRDPLLQDAARLIVQNQIGSTSLLQRRMKLGYNRAGRLMNQLEAIGVVGPSRGANARDVLVKTESELNKLLEKLL